MKALQSDDNNSKLIDNNSRIKDKIPIIYFNESTDQITY